VLPEVGARLRVEAGRRLVEEHELRRVDEAERDVEPPALAAGQRRARPVPEALEVHPGEQLPAAGRGVGPADAVEAGLVDDLLAGARLGEAGAALGDVADPPADADRVLEQVAAGDGGRAGGGAQQRRQHAQGGGLAGAVGAEEADDLAGVDVQVDAAHGFDGSGTGGEGADEAAGFDHVRLPLRER
jgi:hypothetical protein